MTTRENTDTRDEATFWDAVAELDWATACKDDRGCDRLETYILDNWGDDFTRWFDGQVSERVMALGQRLTAWEADYGESIPCGDDGFSDLRHHIVGLGKEVYEATMENPKLALERADSHDYVESFSYCIPHLPSKKKAAMSLDEAKAKVRENHSRWNDEEPLHEAEVEMQALGMIHGKRVKKMPEYYRAWAAVELGPISGLADCPFTAAIGRELLWEVRDALRSICAGNMSHDFAALKEKVQEIRERRAEILEQEMAKLAILRNTRGHGLDNLFGDLSRNPL
jgi:hypothetical protein